MNFAGHGVDSGEESNVGSSDEVLEDKRVGDTGVGGEGMGDAAMGSAFAEDEVMDTDQISTIEDRTYYKYREEEARCEKVILSANLAKSTTSTNVGELSSKPS